MTSKHFFLGLLLSVSLTATAQAGTTVLDFSGLRGFNAEDLNDYYAGGHGGSGSGPGPNYGISFSGDARAFCDPVDPCQSEDSPSAVLRFVDSRASFGPNDDPDAPSVMNVASGFTGNLSFRFAAQDVGSVRIWSGANGGGSLLGELKLGKTAGCDASCAFERASIDFAGLGHSVEFVDYDFNFALFDDMTLTLADAGSAVPEPASWALMIGGFGLAGARLRRRRTVAAAA